MEDSTVHVAESDAEKAIESDIEKEDSLEDSIEDSTVHVAESDVEKAIEK